MIVAILPALDEEAAIARVVRGVTPHVDRVIVVDNGSVDQTARLAAEAGADVVSESRRGYGRACLAGVARAREPGADVLVFLDADGSDAPEDLPRVRGLRSRSSGPSRATSPRNAAAHGTVSSVVHPPPKSSKRAVPVLFHTVSPIRPPALANGQPDTDCEPRSVPFTRTVTRAFSSASAAMVSPSTSCRGHSLCSFQFPPAQVQS
ncbi:MAG: glycosyltransferase family 2 protein [Myxococcales bacterium]|nr:glycosyltransferase family 2 protein [Myxococcales bacterium]